MRASTFMQNLQKPKYLYMFLRIENTLMVGLKNDFMVSK